MINLSAQSIEQQHHQLAEVLTAAILSSEAYRRWQRKGPAHSEQARLVLQELHDLGSRIQALTSSLLGTESDQARLERLQTDLSHAARVTILGELAASMAHEVNQPLAAIVTAAQASIRWLGRDDINVDELASLSSQIVEQAGRSSEIIAQIRHMAMKRAPAFVPVCINTVIDEALLMVSREAVSQGVEIVSRPAPHWPKVVGDRTQLQQVVINLALNAIQAMAPQQDRNNRLTVATRCDGERLFVTVADTGPGISQADTDRIFASFYTTKEEGVGIGLSICRSIVESHGGFIRAFDSKEGAVFSFELPVGQRADTAVNLNETLAFPTS